MNETLMIIARVAGAAVAIYAALIFLTRLNGLRSYSKMSGFDFAMTVAIGSVIASTAVAEEPPLLAGLVALVMIFVLQAVAAKLRLMDKGEALDNVPLLLMRDGEFLEDNMEAADVTRADVWAKLREANVLQLSEVAAVVFETTGDVSVLHASDRVLDEKLLTGVRASA